MNNFASIHRIAGACLPALCLVFAAPSARAEEPSPAPPGPSPAEVELRALHEQGKLESARERNREDAERRHERRELERAKYEADLARYRRMRETYMEAAPSVDVHERSTRDAFLQQRLFLPDLLSMGFSSFSQGGLGSSSVGWVSATALMGSQRGTSFTLGPNLDIRVGQRLTVGGAVTFSRTSDGDSDETAVAVAPRVGALFPAGPLVVWPRLGAIVGVSEGVLGGGRSLGASLELGLVVPLTSHVFVQATPSLTYSHIWHSRDDLDALAVGVRTGLGFAL